MEGATPRWANHPCDPRSAPFHPLAAGTKGAAGERVPAEARCQLQKEEDQLVPSSPMRQPLMPSLPLGLCLYSKAASRTATCVSRLSSAHPSTVPWRPRSK